MTPIPVLEKNEYAESNPALDGWTALDGSTDPDGYFPRVGRGKLDLFRDSETCNDANNQVLPRYDGINNRYDQSPLEFWRKYSITDSSFSGVKLQRDCDSIDALLTAVKTGWREWADHKADEWNPSIFIPRGCNIPHHGPDDLQALFSKDKNMSIGIHGDSLTRHMVGGLRLLMTGIYYNGAIQLRQKTKTKEHWHNCTCDGQFSEALWCRSIALHAFTNIAGPHECDGPRIEWLQGGAHFQSDPQKALQHYFRPKIAKIKKSHSACNTSLHILVSGLNAQSRSLDAKFPHQSREHATIFNQVIADELGKESVVHIVDFWNMTADAPTSDGHHYLTDVNILKADVFATLVNLIQQKASF